MDVRVVVLAALAILSIGTSAVACSGSFVAESHERTVRGSRSCGHYFRDTLFTVPADRQFTLTGIGIDFRRDRALRDSMYVAVIVTNASLWKRNEVRLRRGPHSGAALKIQEHFLGGMVYAPVDTLVVTLINIDEDYQQVEAWPAHVVRWEGYWTPIRDGAQKRESSVGRRRARFARRIGLESKSRSEDDEMQGSQATCPYSGVSGPLTCEHVLPRWARKQLGAFETFVPRRT
jgi:hypothetical protein